MAEIKWIKICTDIFDDEKILLVESLPDADSVIVIWFKLLCLAGKQNNNGIFMMNNKIAYTEEMLATIFRRPINTVRMALSVFENYGMIEIIDNVITIPNWEKHQNIEGLEKIKEQNRKRVAEFRSKQKQLAECNVTGNVASNVTVTLCNALDKNRLDKNRIDNNMSNDTKTFKKPTIEEITKYCEERNNNVDPNKFYDFYESKGWMVGKNKMKDWKAAVRTWEKEKTTSSKKEVSKPDWYDDYFNEVKNVKENNQELSQEEIDKIFNEDNELFK